MEQDREPRNKLKSLRSINIWQRRQEHKIEQKQPLQQMVLGDLDSYVQKNETRSPTYAIHKKKLLIKHSSPGQCGSVGWSLVLSPKVCGFDSQGGHIHRLWVWSLLLLQVCTGGNQSVFLSLSYPHPLQKQWKNMSSDDDKILKIEYSNN